MTDQLAPMPAAPDSVKRQFRVEVIAFDGDRPKGITSHSAKAQAGVAVATLKGRIPDAGTRA